LKEDSRKKIIDKMFEAALKEKFTHLASKYDPRLVFEIWTQIVRGGGIQGHFPKKEWNRNMTIEQALDCLDEYCKMIESFILKHQGPRKKEEEGRLNHR
jgi:hypothetical protein